MRRIATCHIIVPILLFTGCSGDIQQEPPVTPSEVLNELVRAAPWQYIDLDQVELLEIELSADDIIYDTHREVEDGKPFLGQITRFTYTDGYLYVYDWTGSAVYLIDPEGNPGGPFTREGKGPGEHAFVRDITFNSNYIFATDVNNARINRYTRDMVPLEPMNEFTTIPVSITLSLNDERIVSQNYKSFGFAPEDPGQGLIMVSSVDSLIDTLTTILPRIIPVGYQPNVYNTPWFSINRSNRIAASYLPLPWIFLFDEEYNHVRTIIIGYSAFEEMDIPDMDFFRPRGNEGFGGSAPFTSYKLTDSGDLLLIIGNELIHLTGSGDGVFQAAGKYTFINPDNGQPMWLGDVVSSGREGEFYIGNWEYLFLFRLCNWITIAPERSIN